MPIDKYKPENILRLLEFMEDAADQSVPPKVLRREALEIGAALIKKYSSYRTRLNHKSGQFILRI